jgi:Tfp pilus assembly protein PilF
MTSSKVTFAVAVRSQPWSKRSTKAGQQDELPRGLIARADLYLHTGDTDRAQADLEEAMDIATRSGMRLFETDCHLGYARLYMATGDRDAARQSFDAARQLVEETGYHRRDPDLREIKAALENP